MSCDQIQPLLSARLDGDGVHAARAVDDHLAGCPDCRAFESSMARLRQDLRFEAVEGVPDIAGRVMTRLRAPESPHPPMDETDEPATVTSIDPGRSDRDARVWRRPVRRRRWLPAAAAFVIGTLLGGLVVSNGRSPAPDIAAAASLPDRVAAAQTKVQSLQADLFVTEHGRSAAQPVRRFDGTLRYRAPESLALALADTATPGAGPTVRVVADGERWWSAGPRPCPAKVTTCPSEPVVSAVDGRPPFSSSTVVPLDLVVPAQSFARTSDVQLLGERQLDGRRAIGAATTAAQVRPVLDSLVGAAGLRPLFPSDRVELWLDADALVPLLVEVRATDDVSRRSWQENHGVTDAAGDVVLEVRLQHLQLDAPLPDGSFPPPPPGPPSVNVGFRDGAAVADHSGAPGYLPAGFAPYRSGAFSEPDEPVTVRSWVDGRAWLTITSTERWSGDRLFGDVGSLVHVENLANGIAYRNDQTSTIAIHAAGVDVVVTGTVSPDDLRRVAESLPLRGVAVPPTWRESGTTSPSEAARVVPALLVPRDLPGFDRAPAVRVEGDTVAMAYAGGGSRGFVLTEEAGDHLSPPLDQDVAAVQVRGALPGRYSADRGELEWIDGGRRFSLRSTSLSLGELLAVAKRLGPP